MREALGALTLRGRAFLVAGVTATICAVLFGQSALVRVGLLLVLVPVVSALLLGRRAYRLALLRQVSPQVVGAGQHASVQLRLTNEGPRPPGALLLEDHVPYVLGTRPRFVLDGTEQGWTREVSYEVRSDVRGQFEIGPMTVRVSDPFGMVEMGRAFHSTARLTVTPRIVPLPPIPLTGAWTGSGDNRPRAFATGSAEDVTVREYRRGDDLRRVHWRSSARVGELMVRREEQPWQSRATVFLDHRASAHRGEGLASSFETAVQVAASVAVHLADRGYAVRLVTAEGETPADSGWHDDERTSTTPVLERLALLRTSSRPGLAAGWLSEQGAGTLTVAVLGSASEHDRTVLRRMRHGSSASLAVVLDVEGWGPRRASDTGLASALNHEGWKAVPLRPGDRIDRAWRQLGNVAAGRRG